MNIDGTASGGSAALRNSITQWLERSRSGDKLQSERELAANCGLSRSTVRRVVDQLVEAGYLERIHGSGVYAKIAPSDHKLKIYMAYVNPLESDASLECFMTVVRQQIELEVTKRGAIFVSRSVPEADELPSEVLRADGLILAFPFDPEIIPPDKPAVMIGYDYNVRDISCVLADDHLGGLMAARYLVSLGHEKIAFVGDIQRNLWARRRYQAACEVASDIGVSQPLLVEMISGHPINMQMADVLRDNNVTAVFCENDYTCMGLISILHRSGFDVPNNISVIGFDDLPNCLFFHPPLTTLRYPAREIAVAACDEIDRKRKCSGHCESRKILLAPELMIRESCIRRLSQPNESVAGTLHGQSFTNGDKSCSNH